MTPKVAPKRQRAVKGKRPAKPLAIVGIGASAGGLEAFSDLFRTLPATTGLSYVLIQHLDPKRPSVLPQILSQKTAMPVSEVVDGVAPKADHVYIMPPDKDVTVSRGVLSLEPRREVHGRHLPIDRFFQSLADGLKDRAIGVVLSGTASDGALGLEAIKQEGGITFAQDEGSAKFSGMPHSAAATGAADFVLAPKEIAEELVRIAGLPFPLKGSLPRPSGQAGGPVAPAGGDDLSAIFSLVRSATGVDFSLYKEATLQRRIQRRMGLRRSSSLAEYVRDLKANPEEVRALYRDLLILVTGFFRDPEAFAALAKKVFPKFAGQRGPQAGPLRIWVPGCSTGEEAYSLAIALLEFLGRRTAAVPIQIFATDLSEESVEKARAGRYAESLVGSVSASRLARFFVKKEGTYEVLKSVRERCVFARHDITKDPPFSNLDLISCRNVLIYLGREAQARAMGNFHYALRPGGFLFLGKSESLSGFSSLFEPVDRAHKIYARKPGTGHPSPGPRRPAPASGGPTVARGGAPAEFDARKAADQALLSRLAPAAVVVDQAFEVLDFRGHTGPFLEHRPGDASLNLLKMVREGLNLPLRDALRRSKKRSTPVRVEGVKLDVDGRRAVDLEVIPLNVSRLGEDHYLILFEMAGGGKARKGDAESVSGESAGAETGPGKTRRARAREGLLEQELEATRRQLRSVLGEHEAAEAELRAANEEVLSANEELQSINEELETAKEELQSSNEELITVNDELQDRNAVLDEVNNDLTNLFAGTNLPIIMLGRDLRLRRFTRMAEKRFDVGAADAGRSFTNMGLALDFPGLGPLIDETLETGEVREVEVRDRQAHWFSVQIRPYRTGENKIEGVVLTWIDTHALKMVLEEVRDSRDYEEAIVETVREGLLVLDSNMRVKTANRSFYQLFRTTPEETEHRLIYELGNGQWDVPELRRLLGEILPRDAAFQGLELANDFAGVGPKVLRLNAKRILQGPSAAPLILLAFEDITEQKNDADRRLRAEQQLRQMQKLEAIGTLSGGIAHDLNNVFAPIIINAEMGLLDVPPDSPLRKALTLILRSGERGRDLVRQLLLFARKSAPKSEIFPLIPLIEETFRMLRSSIPSTIEMALHLETETDSIRGDPSQIQQVIMNLCANAAYALSDKKGTIDLTLGSVRLGLADLPEADMKPGGYLVFSVADTGVGISQEIRRRLFEPFFTTKPQGEGAGLGLSVVHGIVKSHHGGVSVSSEPGRGSVFRIYLPQVEPAAPPEKAEAGPLTGGQERILLVDDEEVLADSLRSMLQRLGYRVEAITDSRKALSFFLEDPARFDLVLTDKTMPGLTGDELGREIKRARPDIPVILATGYDDPLTAEKIRAAGFQGTLMKPFTLAELARTVRGALDRGRLPKE